MAEEAEVKPRHRTQSRLRFVAPPGMELDGGTERQTIGRYEILKVLGKGAMGVVYQARDPLLDRTVAVKTIVAPSGQGKRIRSAFLERFQREAMAAAKMQHPAIVTIFDVGLDEITGAPFMVLEYLPGESLADRLDRVRMPLGRGIDLALDLASALAFAHRQRIVHRDVKPANVLHAGEQRWKLADFGIARLPDSDLTQVGIFMGTPGYAPPESIREGRYTAQADVFAWGAVLYEILAGRIPYEGPDTKTTNGFVCRGDARPPTAHDRSIPQPLADVCMTALDPSPQRRFKDGSEAEHQLRQAWEHCLREGLVAPMALAGDELSHDKAGTMMHASVTRPLKVERERVPAPGEAMPIDDDSETMVDGRPGAVTVRQGGADGTGRYPLQVDAPAGSGGRLAEAHDPSIPGMNDDAPTRLVLRDGPRRSGPMAAVDPGRGHSGPPAVIARPLPGAAELRDWLEARWPRTELARLRMVVWVQGVLLLIALIVIVAMAL